MPEEGEAKEVGSETLRVLMAKEIADELCDGIAWSGCRKLIMRILVLGEMDKIKEVPEEIRGELKKRVEEVLGVK